MSEVLLDVKELAVRVLHNLYTPKSEPMKSLQVVGTGTFCLFTMKYYEILEFEVSKYPKPYDKTVYLLLVFGCSPVPAA